MKVVKVLMVANELNPEAGGISTFIMNNYSFMDVEKIHVDFVVHTHQRKEVVDYFESHGSKIWTVSPFNLIGYRLFWKRFLKEHHDYDFIHVHSYDPTVLYLRLARHYGISTIAHSHTVNKPRFDIVERICRLNQYGSRFVADYFLGCSRKAIADRFGKRIAASARARVVPNGIDTAKFTFNFTARKRIRAELGVTDDVILLGHVGRLEYQKNQAFSLDVFNAFAERQEQSRLVLIGSGPDEEMLKSKAATLGIGDKVLFLGTRINVEDYLSAFDAFVFPSHYEGFGIALVEAQCSGLPCFASNEIVDEADMKLGLLNRIGLERGPAEWASQLWQRVFSNNTPRDYPYGMYGGGRVHCSEQIRKNGYGIQESAKILESFYIEHSLTTRNH